LLRLFEVANDLAAIVPAVALDVVRTDRTDGGAYQFSVGFTQLVSGVGVQVGVGLADLPPSPSVGSTFCLQVSILCNFYFRCWPINLEPSFILVSEAGAYPSEMLLYKVGSSFL
jgi:hypothetical protein